MIIKTIQKYLKIKSFSKSVNSLNIAEYIALFIGFYIFFSVPLLMLAKFNVIYSSFLSVVTLLIFHQFLKIKIELHIFCNPIFLIICILGIFLRYPTYHYLLGGQDQGVYVSISKFYENEGKTIFSDKTLNIIPATMKDSYVSDNVLSQIYSGTYIMDTEKGERYFQFYPGHSLLMAFTGHFFGDQNRTYSLLILSIISMVLTYLIGHNVFKSQLAGYVGTFVLAIHPLHVFFSRFPTSEVVIVFYNLAITWFFYRFVKTRHLLFFIATLLIWLGLCFTHISSLMYIPLFLFFILLITLRKKITVPASLSLVFGLLLTQLLSIYYGAFYSNSYFLSQITYMTNPLRLLGLDFIKMINMFGIVWIFVYIFSLIFIVFHLVLKQVTYLKYLSKFLDSHKLKLINLFIILLLIAALIRIYTLSFTNLYSGFKWEDLRWGAVNNGLNSILRSTPIVFLMYNVPLLLIFPIFINFIKVKRYSLSVIILFIAFFYFFSIRGLVPRIVPYHYYYARYLLPELTLVLVFIFMFVISKLKVFNLKYLLFFIFLFGYYGYFSFAGYSHSEMDKASKSIEQLSKHLSNNDVVFVINNAYEPHQAQLLLPLKIYYGLNVVRTDLNYLNQYLKEMDGSRNIYIISNTLIGDLGLQVVERTKIVTEELRSTSFIPTKTSTHTHKHDLLLLKYDSKQNNYFELDKEVFPTNFVRTGFYEDGWSMGDMIIHNANIILEENSVIKITTKNSISKAEIIEIVLNDMVMKANKIQPNLYQAIYLDTVPRWINDLHMRISTVKPCEINYHSTDCRDLGIIIDYLAIQPN